MRQAQNLLNSNAAKPQGPCSGPRTSIRHTSGGEHFRISKELINTLFPVQKVDYIPGTKATVSKATVGLFKTKLQLLLEQRKGYLQDFLLVATPLLDKK